MIDRFEVITFSRPADIEPAFQVWDKKRKRFLPVTFNAQGPADIHVKQIQELEDRNVYEGSQKNVG